MSTLQGIASGAVFCRVSGWHDAPRRPYMSDMSGVGMEMINEATRNVQPGNFGTTRLAPIALQLIKPSAYAESIATIENGWGSERCAFFIKIEHSRNMGGDNKIVQYLSGYTSHFGFFRGGNGIIGVGNIQYDMNMRLYFNSSQVFNEVYYTDGMGQLVPSIKPMDASQILYGRNFGMGQNNDITLRPEDIYSGINAQTISDYAAGFNRNHKPGTVYDTRPTFSGGPFKKSTKDNLNAASYLSKILTGSDAAVAAAGGINSTGAMANMDISGEALNRVAEPLISADLTLGQVLQQTGLRENGSITLAELIGLFPNIMGDDVCRIVGLDQTVNPGNQNAMTGKNGEYLNGSDYNIIIANQIKNYVVGLMMEALVTSVTFTCDNTGSGVMVGGVAMPTGAFDVRVTGLSCYVSGANQLSLIEQFKQKLLYEFLVGYTGMHHRNLVIGMHINLFTEATVTISVDGGAPVSYGLPVCADSLFSPVLTANMQNYSALTNDIKVLNNKLLNIF